MLINGLPADSAMRRTGTWSRADEIAALTFERNELWSHLQLQAWGAKPNQLPDLIEIRHQDRPGKGIDEQGKRTNDPDEIRRFFAGLAGR